MKKFKRFIAAMLAIISLVAVAATASADSQINVCEANGDIATIATYPKYMYCNVTDGEYVNIRSGAGTGYTSIGKLHRGDMVYVVSADSTWAKITAPINGYVMLKFLQDTAPSGGQTYITPKTQDQAFGSSGIIQRGNAGYLVANVQIALGFPDSEVDWIFGSKTEQAVIAFQSRNGLDPDGKVGPLTKAALWNEGQALLKLKGYYPV